MARWLSIADIRDVIAAAVESDRSGRYGAPDAERESFDSTILNGNEK
jgi:hypothetical protein